MTRYQSLLYIKTHSGRVTVEQFKGDWRPIGDMEWGLLLRDGIADERGGFIYLTPKGEALLQKLEDER